MKEPKHRDDLKGKYWLKNGRILVTVISFDTKKEAEAWGKWNNYGEENPYEIVLATPTE